MGNDTPFYVEGGKVIADAEEAHEVANALKPGMDAAIAVEKRLKNEHETGLTEDQMRNNEVVYGLQAKYPDAFDTVVDKNGRTVLILRKHQSASPAGLPLYEGENIFTQDGFAIVICPGNNFRVFDPTPVLNYLDTGGRGYGSINVDTKRLDNQNSAVVKVKRVNVENDTDLANLRERLIMGQTVGEVKNREQKLPVTAKSILANL